MNEWEIWYQITFDLFENVRKKTVYLGSTFFPVFRSLKSGKFSFSIRPATLGVLEWGAGEWRSKFRDFCVRKSYKHTYDTHCIAMQWRTGWTDGWTFQAKRKKTFFFHDTLSWRKNFIQNYTLKYFHWFHLGNRSIAIKSYLKIGFSKVLFFVKRIPDFRFCLESLRIAGRSLDGFFVLNLTEDTLKWVDWDYFLTDIEPRTDVLNVKWVKIFQSLTECLWSVIGNRQVGWKSCDIFDYKIQDFFILHHTGSSTNCNKNIVLNVFQHLLQQLQFLFSKVPFPN